MKGMFRSNKAGPVAAGGLLRLKVPIIAKSVSITDPGAANAPFTSVLAALPKGLILAEAIAARFQLTRVGTNITATFTGNISLGSAATADATLNGAEVDLIASTAITTAVAGVSPSKLYSGGTPVLIDNTANNKNVNLNGFIADAAIAGNDAVLVDGVFELLYAVMDI